MKTGGKDIKKGEVRNPEGRRAPIDIIRARQMTRAEFERIANELIYMTRNELMAKTTDPKSTIFELLVASILHAAIVDGDERRLAFVMEQVLGKLPQRLEHANPDGSAMKLFTPEQLKAMAQSILDE